MAAPQEQVGEGEAEVGSPLKRQRLSGSDQAAAAALANRATSLLMNQRYEDLAGATEEPTTKKIHELLQGSVGLDGKCRGSRVLWLCLRCLAGDTEMVVAIVSVSKAWKEEMNRIIPLRIFGLIRLLRDDCQASTRVEHFLKLFDAYCPRESPLYRAMSLTGDSVGCSWPAPQVQFLDIAVSVFVKSGESAGDKAAFCKNIYDETVIWVQKKAHHHAQAIALKLEESLATFGWTELQKILPELEELAGTLHPICVVTGYLNKFSLQSTQQAPPSIQKCAMRSLKEELSRTNVTLTFTLEGVGEDPMKLKLLARGLRLCKQLDCSELLGNTCSRVMEAHREDLLSLLPQVAENGALRVICKNSGRAVKKVDLQHAIMEQSGYLPTLQVRDGDIIELDCKEDELQWLLNMCELNRRNPMEEIQKPLQSTNLVECGVMEEHASAVDSLTQEHLFVQILLANHLAIKWLLDLTCAKVASEIKGKTTEEIRKQFNIVNDFTPEEEAQVREENRWCEDA